MSSKAFLKILAVGAVAAAAVLYLYNRVPHVRSLLGGVSPVDRK